MLKNEIEKWPKDRPLEFGDILNYQKNKVALTETHRLMRETDEIEYLFDYNFDYNEMLSIRKIAILRCFL